MMAGPGGASARSTGWRVFLTVWLVYSLFATTNVVRETYLAISLGERFTVRVDPYQHLHPDLFEVPGRGWYINSNPGASIVGAVPYGILVRPAIALATRIRPSIVAPKPPARYDDPRQNRTRFLNRSRERGLDIVLGLAALGTGVTVMAPLGALAAVLMFLYLRNRLDSERMALGYALIFALVTPMFFRAAFLNQNAVVAYLVLGAWILKVGLAPRPAGETSRPRVLAGIGLLLGYAIVCDYSAVPLAVVFGCWILADGWRRGGISVAVRDAATYSAGAVLSLSILFAYQWAAFGNPLWPAQRYMPPTEFSVRGWSGFTAPTAHLLSGNLFDLRYGLFAFCPALLAAVAAPFVRAKGTSIPASRVELAWIAACFAGLLLFSSANQFANLQWNTGVRYMVPVVPLLFIAAVPVLEAMPRLARWFLVGASAVIIAAVTMTREDIPTALKLLIADGPTLPVLTVLRKMESAYQVPLPSFTFWIVTALVGAALTLVWRWRPEPARTT
jgi:hypothetical protein